MSRHLERLLKLDHLLRQQKRQTVGSLALDLEISERTMRNDLAFLRDRFNAPLIFTRKNGYHYTDLAWRLPSVSLSQGELFALILGARVLDSYSGSAYAPQLRSAIARLSERLPEQTWVDLQSVAEEHILFRSGAETRLDPEVWLLLEEACQKHQRVEMKYRTASRGDALSDRVLDPYLLHIYRGSNPYVIGYCHTREEIRWFRVDRIQTVKLLSEKFVTDPTFDPKDHLEMIFQVEVGGVPQTIAVWFDAITAPFVRERRWHPTQEVHEHPDGSITLGMTVRGMNDVKRWILGYGKGAKVLEPPKLVAMIREEIQGLNERYQ